jgi:hypothetical protein
LLLFGRAASSSPISYEVSGQLDFSNQLSGVITIDPSTSEVSSDLTTGVTGDQVFSNTSGSGFVATTTTYVLSACDADRDCIEIPFNVPFGNFDDLSNGETILTEGGLIVYSTDTTYYLVSGSVVQTPESSTGSMIGITLLGLFLIKLSLQTKKGNGSTRRIRPSQRASSAPGVQRGPPALSLHG